MLNFVKGIMMILNAGEGSIYTPKLDSGGWKTLR
jgi:hypothetical protein